MNFTKLNNIPVYLDLLDQVQPYFEQWNSSQICITSPVGHENDLIYGNGSLAYDWSKLTVDSDGKQHVPLRETVLKEEDFTQICTPFIGTDIEDIWCHLKKYYDVGRVRVFENHPGSCLSWHIDGQDRVHYPIKTQPGCLMVIEDEVQHLEQNQWYYTKTTAPHSAFNGSKEKRIHLVANILGIH
jgi:hypothetical protein